MGKPYSMDLRERLVAYVCAGNSARSAARVFNVGVSTAVRFAAEHRRTGSVAPKRQGRAPGTAGKLAPHMDFLIEVVQCEPDITLRELAGALEDACGVRVQLSSIHRALANAGYSYKKRTAGTGA